jgi:hypothetical protein
MHVEVKKIKLPLLGLKQQPIPIKDFLNFKAMTSNEILLNMANHPNFATSELIGALVELANRDRDNEHDWTQHPWTAPCLAKLKVLQPQLTPRHLIST